MFITFDTLLPTFTVFVFVTLLISGAAFAYFQNEVFPGNPTFRLAFMTFGVLSFFYIPQVVTGFFDPDGDDDVVIKTISAYIVGLSFVAAEYLMLRFLRKEY